MSELVLTILVVGAAVAVSTTLVVEDVQPATDRTKNPRAGRSRHGHAGRPTRRAHAASRDGRPDGAVVAPAPEREPALAHVSAAAPALAPAGSPPAAEWMPSSTRTRERAPARPWPEVGERGEPDPGVRWWQRLRSACLLTLGVVLIGVGTAAVICIVVVVLVTLLRSSVGAG